MTKRVILMNYLISRGKEFVSVIHGVRSQMGDFSKSVFGKLNKVFDENRRFTAPQEVKPIIIDTVEECKNREFWVSKSAAQSGRSQ